MATVSYPTTPQQANLLGSWKEIAAYLRKGVRTVQRWEQQLGLPVRRPDVAAKGMVFASPEELDKWLSMHWARRSNGFSMIGNTEGLVGPGSELFEMVERKQKIYRKKAVATPLTSGFSMHMNETHTPSDQIPGESKTPEPGRMPVDVQRESDRLLLARYAPPSVVVTEQLEIVHTRGHTGAFLELPAGKISMNILKMARPGLLFDLQSAIEGVKKSNVEVVRPGVVVEGMGTSTTTDLRISRFKSPVQEKVCFLITFEAPSGTVAPQEEAIASPLSDDERILKDKQIAQLRQELAATRGISSRSSRQWRLPTRSYSRPMRRSSRSTRNFRARMKSCRLRRKSWNRPMRNCIPSMTKCSTATTS